MNQPIVSVKNLSVRFGTFYAVKNVSFQVDRGEIFGFLGANGAGKTTTIRVLCGLLPATEGTVFIDNERFTRGKENLIKQKVGYMSQKFTLYDGISIAENMDFAAALHHLDKKRYEQRRTELLRFIDFREDLSLLVRDLPGGIKQEIALCVSLLHDPPIIFLDEPTAGVAPKARARFWDLIRHLAQTGKTVFVTTHYMDEAENCDRIALMRAGELIALDTPAALKKKTFQGQLYLITPKRGNVPLPDKSLFEIFEPYGRHYHALFKKETTSIQKQLAENFNITPIAPSLEDVFIRLVEGKDR